jgi:hypothetical protein
MPSLTYHHHSTEPPCATLATGKKSKPSATMFSMFNNGKGRDPLTGARIMKLICFDGCFVIFYPSSQISDTHIIIITPWP